MKPVWIGLISLAVAAGAHAQESKPRVPGGAEPVAVEKVLLEKMVMAKKAAVESRVTPGAPYSAEAVNESTQMLADGNRIVQKSVTRVYRDSEGRTRRDQISDTGAVESTFIVDPQTGTNYVFEQKVREAMPGPDTAMMSNHDGPPDIVQFKGNMAAFAGGDVLFERRVEQGAKADAQHGGRLRPGLVARRAEDRVREPARRPHQPRDLHHERRRQRAAEPDPHPATGRLFFLVARAEIGSSTHQL